MLLCHYASDHGVERTETFRNEQNVVFYSDFCLKIYMVQLKVFYAPLFFCDFHKGWKVDYFAVEVGWCERILFGISSILHSFVWV